MTDDTDHAWLKDALPRTGTNSPDKDWTVIDLRPLRADPQADASTAWRDAMRRYDIVVAPDLI